MRKSREDEYQKKLKQVKKEVKKTMGVITKWEKGKRMERFKNIQWLRSQYLIDFLPLSRDEQNAILRTFYLHGAMLSILFTEIRNEVVLRLQSGFLVPTYEEPILVIIDRARMKKLAMIPKERIIAVSHFKSLEIN